MPPRTRSQTSSCRDPHGRFMTCPISLENIPVGDDGQPLNRAYAIVTPNGSQVYRRSNLTEHLRHHGNWWPHAGAGAMIVPDNVRASLGLPPRGAGRTVNRNAVRSLHNAVINNDIESVRTLIRSGANVNAVDDEWMGGNGTLGWSPLHLAAYRGHRDIVALLVDRGANVDAVDNYGWTALHLAAYRGHRDIVELILASGANVSVTNRNGMTARNRATRTNVRALFDNRPR